MTGPFHLVLRTAIRERGLPLDRLRSRLAERGIRIGLASLSDWQHGRAWPRRPNSLRAIAVLEEILGLPRHALTGLLATHQLTPFRPQQGVDEYHGPMGELLDALPGARDWNLEVITSEHAVNVDAHRSPSHIVVRSLARARRDDVDRAVMRYFGAPGCEIDRVRVAPVRNCAVGRLLRHPEGRVLAAELLFGQRLQAGETWVWEYEVHDPTTSETESDFAHAFRRPEGTCLMEVRFHPDALPSGVHDYFRADLYVDQHRLNELPLNAHHSVHVTMSGMNSGVIGISWEWPE
ncbi:hypothetical protein FXN61_31220 [Lentzea sp. PSKA42]|uniref:XRE family transcriptional regulator n=1 Tax=Lentzea indica TaxID=2604800 RepID=A0ABX1FPT0_9PSEU|nr:hypothetical protein [Lentzea indica]NKE61015.1 hypothetical protein [Lentzea indica]